MTGHPPFSNKNKHHLMQSILQDEITIPKHLNLSKAVTDLIDKVGEADPATQ